MQIIQSKLSYDMETSILINKSNYEYIKSHVWLAYRKWRVELYSLYNTLGGKIALFL